MDRVIALGIAILLAVVGGVAWAVVTAVEADSAAARAATLTGGDPARGRILVSDRGCGFCHTIPRVYRANGLVGPDLSRFGSRVYIAGVLANNPRNLIHWLRDPPGIDPLTAMPNLGLEERDARDIAAFLYTLD